MSLLETSPTSPEERAIEDAMLARIDYSALEPLKRPADCVEDALPFLAWEFGVSHWDSNWTVEKKREAAAEAIPFHKIKGSRAAVEQVLLRFSPLLTIVEGWQATPRRQPRSFEVRAPSEISLDILTVETTDAIIRDIAAAKPVGTHFDFVQTFEASAAVHIVAAASSLSVFRTDASAVHDVSRDWSAVLQTEDGEPLFLPDGSDVLETH